MSYVLYITTLYIQLKNLSSSGLSSTRVCTTCPNSPTCILEVRPCFSSTR
jgi:hypothetical protein